MNGVEGFKNTLEPFGRRLNGRDVVTDASIALISQTPVWSERIGKISTATTISISPMSRPQDYWKMRYQMC